MYAIVCCQKQNNVNHVTKPSAIAPRPRRWGNEGERPAGHETVRNLYFQDFENKPAVVYRAKGIV